MDRLAPHHYLQNQVQKIKGISQELLRLLQGVDNLVYLTSEVLEVLQVLKTIKQKQYSLLRVALVAVLQELKKNTDKGCQQVKNSYTSQSTKQPSKDSQLSTNNQNIQTSLIDLDYLNQQIARAREEGETKSQGNFEQTSK